MEGMKVIIIAGPPASGKTSVMVHTIRAMKQLGLSPAVVKIDCLATEDDKAYQAAGVPVAVGLSEDICPDHYYVVNLEEMISWGQGTGADILLVETAGLCHRCAPGIDKALSVCVVDCHSSIKVPRKIGPVLTTADVIILSKGDSVSQAEREVFYARLREINPEADILETNGLTGAGSEHLARVFMNKSTGQELIGSRLRHPMPTAICSYCMGEIRVGNAFQQGVVYKMDFPNAVGGDND